jgi:hypothetical protein
MKSLSQGTPECVKGREHLRAHLSSFHADQGIEVDTNPNMLSNPSDLR